VVLRRDADEWDRRRVIGHSILKIGDRIVRLQSTKLDYLKRGFSWLITFLAGVLWRGMLRQFQWRYIRHKLQKNEGGEGVEW
jgi:hypothetical protein